MPARESDFVLKWWSQIKSRLTPNPFRRNHLLEKKITHSQQQGNNNANSAGKLAAQLFIWYKAAAAASADY